MQTFLKAFVDIVLWRKGPQDLPSSRLLVIFTLLAEMLVSVLQLRLMNGSPAAYFMFVVVATALLMIWIWVVLKVYGRPERYPQTIAAILGSSALIGLALAVPLQLMVGVDFATPPTPAQNILGLGLAFVFVLVAGRIVKLATDSNLFTGFCIVAVYVLVINTMAVPMVPHGT